ncbi:hydroxyacid dehydrogenase [Propylenella binzhouense]|uniref:Hydroxyacid dehydrogenase n=1 Tax=Propylenella binzhouense TaxID=2555902 RepID=A0A964T0S8_9HYPH|nr:hydroxyacid dehydrogenase [Propylenella binzhouense]MYZ46273.1 hydroxyacid dehydrogenase [Propylenella binzhouense]
MKVVVFETEEWEHQACLRLQPEHQVVCTRDALDEEAVSNHAEAETISTFVNSTLSAAVLMRFPELKLIATRSTGYDHIDLDYCRSRGIVVSNVPDYGDSTVAEHAFALLLAVARHLVEAVERTRRGNFSQSGLRGFELRDKTLGVIGTGRIGRRAIEIAKGFGMTVLAFDLHPDEAAAQRLGFRYADVDAVLATADVLTLHVPATPETAGLLSDRAFGLMKPGAVVINTARGNIIDIPALVRALADGRLRAAGLDVLPQEPLIREEAQIFRADAPADGHDLRALVANHVLLRFPNVIVTPHNAYNTDSAVGRIIETTLDNIEAFARGEPRNVVSHG